jgi:hypothetical protein
MTDKHPKRPIQYHSEVFKIPAPVRLPAIY